MVIHKKKLQSYNIKRLCGKRFSVDFLQNHNKAGIIVISASSKMK